MKGSDLAMPPEDDVEKTDNRDLLKKNITLTRGIAIVVGGMIGTGIFVTPTYIAKSVGSPGASVIMWVLGGLIAAAGGMSFAELGTMFPVSGAEITYINKIFGPVPAFLTAWFNHFLLDGMGIAIGILGSTKYFWSLFYPDPEKPVSLWADKLLAQFINMVLIFLTAFAPTLNVQSMVVESSLKAGATLVIISAGLGYLLAGHEQNIAVGFQETELGVKGWAGALSGVFWSYFGWEMLSSMTSEVQNPRRNVPLIVGVSVTLITVLYTLTVISYHIAIPITDMMEDIPVASRFGGITLGKFGEVLLALVVVVSSLGNVHCTLLMASRYVHSAAVEGLLPQSLSLVSKRFKTPIISIFFLGLETAVFTLVGDLNGLIDSAVFCRVPFYTLCCVGVFIMRRRAPELERPYRVPLVFPAFFILVGIYSSITPFTTHDTWQISVFWVGVLLAGVPVYFIFVRNIFKITLFAEVSRWITGQLADKLGCE